jgi:ribonuclease M5
MKKIKEVIVVEGKDDTKRVQLAVDADTIETNGSAIDEDTLQQIEHAQETRGVIVFTDPDFPGEKIRKIISARVVGVKHAFLSSEEAKPKHKGSLGIEHASVETIRQALDGLYEEKAWDVPLVKRSFLMKEGLIGGAQSKAKRLKLGERLRIGYTNGKQLQKRLNLFGITEEEVKQTLKEMREEEEQNDAY